MSDRMTPIPFGKLMERITDEYNKNGSLIFPEATVTF